MNRLARTLQLVATVLLGLMSGFFFAFAVDVVPAMLTLDATTYVTVQQVINSVVRNAVFGSVYFGSLVVTLSAAGISWIGSSRGLAWGWTVVAIVYATLVFWLTRSVNVPINDAVAMWSPAAPPIDWTDLRDRWNASNMVRAVAAFACFLSATVLLFLGTVEESGRRTVA